MSVQAWSDVALVGIKDDLTQSVKNIDTRQDNLTSDLMKQIGYWLDNMSSPSGRAADARLTEVDNRVEGLKNELIVFKAAMDEAHGLLKQAEVDHVKTMEAG